MTDWLVPGLIPKGHAVLLLGQPHSGKSWFAEQLAVCIASGSYFLGKEEGFAIEPGSVILIDEDTPTDTLEGRLNRLAAGLSVDLDDIPLHVDSMQGFNLADNTQVTTLCKRISQMKPPVLVIIDSLSSVMGVWNQNDTGDAVKAATKWNQLKTTGATLLLIHHMSLKKQGSYKDWDFTPAAMGNTQLIGKCDTALGTWRIPPEKPTRFVIKAKPRRSALKVTGPLGVSLEEPNDESWAYLRLLEEMPVQPSEIARSLFPLFGGEEMGSTVNDLKNIVQGAYSDSAIRDALHELEEQRVLIRAVEAGRTHQFRYKLNPDFENPYSLTTTYWDELRQ